VATSDARGQVRPHALLKSGQTQTETAGAWQREPMVPDLRCRPHQRIPRDDRGRVLGLL